MLVALALLAAASQRPAAAHAQQTKAEGLAADIAVTYKVRDDASAVDVTWDVTLDNTGPSPGADAEDGGADYYPDSTSLVLIGPGQDLQAKAPGAQPLGVEVEPAAGGGGGFATVHFGRSLAYGDSVSFAVSYSVPAGRSEDYSISADYIYLPPYYGIAADTYRSNRFQVIAPASLLPNINISSSACRASAGGYECDLGQDGTGVEVEMIDPSARVVETHGVTAGGHDLTLTLRYLGDDKASSACSTSARK